MGRLKDNYYSQPESAPVMARQEYVAPQTSMMNNPMQAMFASNPAIAREVATVQTQMAVAQMFPRNIGEVQRKIDSACSRLQLASSATYSFARGGTDIKGPSIRLAEALINAYGNAKAGFEITAQTETESTVRAYAFDMETNTQMERTFVVPHRRDTRGGSYLLTDSRDIYEAVANQAARRVRACILAIIPSDLQEYAVQKCVETEAANVHITPDTLTKLVAAFSEYDVTKAQIEAFIQRNLEAITTSQYLRLKSIYTALRDGVAKPETFFKAVEPSDAEKTPVNESKEEKSINSPLPTESQAETQESAPQTTAVPQTEMEEATENTDEVPDDLFNI